MIDLSKSVFVDVGNQYDTFIGGKDNTLSQQTVYLVQGDILTLKVYLRNVTGDNTTTEETLQTDESLIVGVKEVSSLSGDDGGLFVYQTAFASQTDTDGDTYYEGVMDLTSGNLTTALAEKRNAECVMEFSVQKNDGTFGKSFQGSLVITSELSPSGSGVSLGGGGGGLGGGADTSLLTQMLNSLRAEVGTWSDYLEGKALALAETEYTLPDSDGDGIVDVADDDYVAPPSVGVTNLNALASPSVGVTNLVATEVAEQLVSSNSPSNLVAITQPQEGVSSLQALAQPTQGVSGLEALTQPTVGVTNLQAEEEEVLPFIAPASSFREYEDSGSGSSSAKKRASYVGTDGKLYKMNTSSGWDAVVDNSNNALTGITGLVGQYHAIDGDGKIYGPDPQYHPTNSRGGYNELSYLQGFEFVEGSGTGRLWGANGDGKLYANPIMCYHYGGGTGEAITNANAPLYVESDFVPSIPIVTLDGIVNGVHQYSEIDNVVWAKYTGSGYNTLGQIAVVTSDGKGYHEVQVISSGFYERSYMVPIYENATTEMTGIEQFSIGDTTSPKNLVILKTDGSVWCQGKNYYGQTGQGTATGDTTYPARVLDDSVASLTFDLGSSIANINPAQHPNLPSTYETTYTYVGNDTYESEYYTITKYSSAWALFLTSTFGQGNSYPIHRTDYTNPANPWDAEWYHDMINWHKGSHVTEGGGTVTGVSKVISGVNTNFALKDNGTVLFWGWNRYLVGGTGGTVGNNAPYKATLMQDASGNTLTGVVDITDQFDYGSFYFKKSDGTIWATGTESQGWEADTNVFYNSTGRAYQIV